MAEQEGCTSACVTCEWCGAATTSGNHGKIEECIEALQREVSVLRAALLDRERRLEGMATRDPALPRWKFRTA